MNTAFRSDFMDAGQEQLSGQARVAVVMGSQSDWTILRHTADMLMTLKIAYESRILSAHRTPDRMVQFARTAQGRGLQIIIAGAGGAAHLPGMLAGITLLPVLGVPMFSSALQGVDSLLSIVQMPAGVPVGTLAIGKPGAINAALFAAAILGLSDPEIAGNLAIWRQHQTDQISLYPQD